MRANGITVSNNTMNVTMGSRTGVGFGMTMNNTVSNFKSEKSHYETSMRELLIKQQAK